MDISNYLYLSAILFTIGAIGVVIRRNAIVVFMCIVCNVHKDNNMSTQDKTITQLLNY